MKYIKKFNEELNPNTYIKVSKSLKDLKHNKRADKLEKHARIISQLNKLNELVKDLKKYEPYGIFEAGSSQGSKLKEQFALKMWYDDWSLKESFEDYEKEYNSYFWIRISIGLLPILEEGEEEHIRDYYSEMSGDVYDGISYVDKLSEMEEANTIGRVCQYFGQSDFWSVFSGPSIYVKMAIEDNKIVIKGIDVDEDSEDVLSILGRKSGIQFKNLLIKLFSSEKFDFPTEDGRNLQQLIKYELCENTGFSSKYQFVFGEIGEFIKKESINKFYHSFNFVN
jgi:hypothetical protein